MVSRDPDRWKNFTDEQLIEYEQSLYDDEVNGEDTWEVRDDLLWEMNYRGLCGRNNRR
jgi:hypothetical protein